MVREWHYQKIQAETTPMTTSQGIGFTVRFENEDDARLFSQQFALQVALSGGKSTYAA